MTTLADCIVARDLGGYSVSEAVEAYNRLASALGQRDAESLQGAAERAYERGGRLRRAVAVELIGPGDPWAQIKRAIAILDGHT